MLEKDEDIVFMIEDIIKNISSICALKAKIPDYLFKDKELLLYILNNAGEFIYLLPEELKNDRDLITVGTRNNPAAILGASLEIQEDINYVSSLIDFCISKNRGNGLDFFFSLPLSIQKDKDLVKKIISNSRFPLYKYQKEFQTDLEFIKISLDSGPHNIIYIEPTFLNDALLMEYLYKRPDLIIDRCSDVIKKDKKIILKLLDFNTVFFKKVENFHRGDKFVVLKYLVSSNISEIINYPSLKSNKRAIRYLLQKGLMGGNPQFLMNHESFLNYVDYPSLINKINYRLELGDDTLQAFRYALDWEIIEMKKDYLNKILSNFAEDSTFPVDKI